MKNKNIFKELRDRKINYSVGRAYLLGGRIYFIVASERYSDRLKGLDFTERKGSGLWEKEMDDTDCMNFARAKENFVIETQNEHGAMFELENNSMKGQIKKTEALACKMVLAIERIVNSETQEDLESKVLEAEKLIAGL